MTTLGGRALTKSYGDTEVVRSVDLEVHPAEVVGLLGPNGAGKTTTFNMLAGGVRPSSGRVTLGEAEITDLPMYRRARLGITYLPQEPSIFRKLSVADNVYAILETVEPDRAVRQERLRELLRELGLTEKADRRGDALSGGERRRVEITRALVLDPKFMLLDEPFAGIDPIAVADIQGIIEQLKSLRRAPGAAEHERQVRPCRREARRDLHGPPQQILGVAPAPDPRRELGEHADRGGVERVLLEVRLQEPLGDVEPVLVERHRRLDQARMKMRRERSLRCHAPP